MSHVLTPRRLDTPIKITKRPITIPQICPRLKKSSSCLYLLYSRKGVAFKDAPHFEQFTASSGFCVPHFVQ